MVLGTQEQDVGVGVVNGLRGSVTHMPATPKEDLVSRQELIWLTRQIAAKWGHDSFNLRDDEFDVLVERPPVPYQAYTWLVSRQGIIRIWFNVSVDSDRFESEMLRALEAAKRIKDTRGTSLQLWGTLKIPTHLVPSQYRKMYLLPPLLDHGQIEYRIEYHVKAKHRETGLIWDEKGPLAKGLGAVKEVARDKLSKLVFAALERIKEQSKNHASEARAGDVGQIGENIESHEEVKDE